jgi:hypothetical protein
MLQFWIIYNCFYRKCVNIKFTKLHGNFSLRELLKSYFSSSKPKINFQFCIKNFRRKKHNLKFTRIVEKILKKFAFPIVKIHERNNTTSKILTKGVCNFKGTYIWNKSKTFFSIWSNTSVTNSFSNSILVNLRLCFFLRKFLIQNWKLIFGFELEK